MTTVFLSLSYLGEGRFQTRTNMDYELCMRTYVNGDAIRAKISKSRSVKQNNYFHALVAAAFENQRGGPKCETWRHLKAWLLIEAGHCDEVRLPMTNATPASVELIAGGMARALKRHCETLVVTRDRRTNDVVMRFAKSLSFAATDADAAGAVVTRVTEIICDRIVPGVDPMELIDMAKRRAA
jgi:hypothetical protein